MAECILTPHQVELFKRDLPYGSPFKHMPLFQEEYSIKGGMHSTTISQIFDSFQDYQNSRSWN